MRARTWVALAASSALLGGCGWFGPSHEPHVAPGPAVVHAPYRCPRIGDTLVATPGASTLPTGAVAARLCVTDRPGPFVPPYDDLTSHLDRLVRLVDRQPITGTAQPGTARLHNTGCGGPTPPGFAIVLRYAGGTRTITGNALECQGDRLQVGQGVRSGSMRIWTTYLRLLSRQRHDRPVPDRRTDPTALVCPARNRGVTTTPLVVVRRLVAAEVCPVDRRGRPLGAVHLSPSDLAQWRLELSSPHPRAEARRGPGCPTWPAPQHYLVVALDAWGDRTVAEGMCRSYASGPAVWTTYEQRVVRLHPTTARMLLRLLAASRGASR